MSTSSAAKCVSPKFAGECLQKRQITVEKLSVINANDSIVVEIEVFCGYKCTDKGNADRMVALYGNDIRHCRGLKTWLLWDGVRWVPDKVDRILEIAKNTAVLIDAEVSFEQDIERKTELRKWAKESESQRRLKAMIELAKSDPRIAVAPEELDANGWLVTCLSGTLDLKARQLREHRPEDLITKLAPVEYDPSASSEKFYKVLSSALPLEVGGCLQRAYGYALTTSTQEKALFYLYGLPNAMKSTCLEPVFEALGDYGGTVDISTFAKKMQRPGSARADIVSLDGVRAAQCSEVPNKMVFNEAFLKSMTSGNPKSARGLYELRERKITPVTKFFLEGNFRPKIDFEDEASFLRIYIFPFVNSLRKEDIDKALKDELKTDQDAQEAIFAWVVQGCYDWQDIGLQAPDEVIAATKDYQRMMNPLCDFVQTECVNDPDAKTSNEDLYNQFQQYKADAGRKENITRVWFSRYLSQLGYESCKWNGKRGYVGIRLRDIDDDFDVESSAEDSSSSTPRTVKGERIQKCPCTVDEYRELITNAPTYCPSVPENTSTAHQKPDLPDLILSILQDVNESGKQLSREQLRDLVCTKIYVEDLFSDILCPNDTEDVQRTYDTLVENDSAIRRVIFDLTASTNDDRKL